MHTRNCRNHAGRSFINLTGTTISEDPKLWNQLRRLQLPLKWLSFFGNFIEFSSCEGRIEKASEDSVIYVNDTKILNHFFNFFFM